MRYTETKLDKLIRIHHGMVDRIMEQACDDLEAIKPKPRYDYNICTNSVNFYTGMVHENEREPNMVGDIYLNPINQVFFSLMDHEAGELYWQNI